MVTVKWTGELVKDTVSTYKVHTLTTDDMREAVKTILAIDLSENLDFVEVTGDTDALWTTIRHLNNVAQMGMVRILGN